MARRVGERWTTVAKETTVVLLGEKAVSRRVGERWTTVACLVRRQRGENWTAGREKGGTTAALLDGVGGRQLPCLVDNGCVRC